MTNQDLRRSKAKMQNVKHGLTELVLKYKLDEEGAALLKSIAQYIYANESWTSEAQVVLMAEDRLLGHPIIKEKIKTSILK